MLEKKSIRIEGHNYNLQGYTMGLNPPEITQKLSSNNRNSPITNKFTAYLLETMWLFLFDTHLIEEEEIQKAFQCNGNIAKVFEDHQKPLFSSLK